MPGNYPGFDLFAQMQQLAARLSGGGASAADIAGEWQRALGAAGANPFADTLHAMRGQGAQGVDAWSDAVAPWLDAARREGSAWLGLPAFGIGREHQERLQQLMQAQLESQQREAEHNLLMLKALQDAHGRFERKLAARAEPGKQLQSSRALFDLWIDAAEEAYAEVALSPEFRKSYGAMVNAQMKMRQAVQREVEHAGEQLGMPTRSEVDAAHRKIAELERSVRRLRDAVPESEPVRKPAAKKASPLEKVPVKKAPAKKAAAKKKGAKR
jgi:class III poly(R)-hydroxyalkanoic acid synthase PhaE subunit